MKNMKIKMECTNKNLLFGDFDWFRLQCKILKHMVLEPREAWDYIFPGKAGVSIKEVKKDLCKIGCPGRRRKISQITICTCLNCNREYICRNSSVQQEFRQRVYAYIKETLSRDRGKEDKACHSHNCELGFVTKEGVLIIFKKDPQNLKEYIFRTIFLPEEELLPYERLPYIKAPIHSRAIMLRSRILERFRRQDLNIHYADNFYK